MLCNSWRKSQASYCYVVNCKVWTLSSPTSSRWHKWPFCQLPRPGNGWNVTFPDYLWITLWNVCAHLKCWYELYKVIHQKDGWLDKITWRHMRLRNLEQNAEGTQRVWQHLGSEIGQPCFGSRPFDRLNQSEKGFWCKMLLAHFHPHLLPDMLNSSSILRNDKPACTSCWDLNQNKMLLNEFSWFVKFRCHCH